MKFNIKEVKVTDIDGNDIKVPDLHKAIANIVFSRAETVDVHNFALSLNNTGEAEMSEETAMTVCDLLAASKMYYFVKAPILSYINFLNNEESKTRQ